MKLGSEVLVFEEDMRFRLVDFKEAVLICICALISFVVLVTLDSKVLWVITFFTVGLVYIFRESIWPKNRPRERITIDPESEQVVFENVMIARNLWGFRRESFSIRFTDIQFLNPVLGKGSLDKILIVPEGSVYLSSRMRHFPKMVDAFTELSCLTEDPPWYKQSELLFASILATVMPIATLVLVWVYLAY